MLDEFIARHNRLVAKLEKQIGISTFFRSYSDLERNNNRYIRNNTGFWSLEHFDLQLWFLCNGQFDVLENLVDLWQPQRTSVGGLCNINQPEFML